MHTSATWTNGYFGTLYSGEPAATFESKRAREDGRNLIGELQQAGVAVRWIAFHQNGIPEGSAARVSAYRGLRSIFLSDRFGWLPRALGLDYHLVLPSGALDSLFMGDAERRLFHWLNRGPARQNLFIQVLLPEVRQIRGTARRTATIFHLGWQAAIGADRPPAAWEADDPLDEVDRIYAQVRANDYRYEPQYEWIAEVQRRQAAAAMQILGERLQDFMEALEAAGLADDTLVIVTADHGSANIKGRFWYGYHPIEEVVRVPFLLLGDVARGRDERFLTTIDLTQGILEYLGTGARLNDAALSFLSERRHEFAASVTLRSDINREWFLLLYGSGRKYRINLHPDGDGAVTEFRLDGFTEELVAEHREPPAEIAAPLREALYAFGFPGGDVHRLYRDLVTP